MKMRHKKKVLLALSGGVDSSVAAALLLRGGYEVVGAFMKNWSGENGEDPCWINERRDAMRVAAHLGIPFMTLDFEREYRKEVVEYLYREYAAGRTPNPDVLCNTVVKFPLLWREAKKLGAEFIATGHYARIAKRSARFRLLAGVDKEKDQSYFLHGLTHEDLAHTLFPVGGMKKIEVRALAKKLGLSTAEKRSTRGICFIGKMDMRAFLGKRIPEHPGEIVTTKGERVGTHPGIAFFTVGQRHGIGIGGGAPYYVAGKDVKTNTLIVAQGKKDPMLYRKQFAVCNAHWIVPRSGIPLRGTGAPKFPLICRIRTRYREPLATATVSRGREGLLVTCRTPRRAVTPGQSVVFYRGQECLGGGVIRDNC